MIEKLKILNVNEIINNKINKKLIELKGMATNNYDLYQKIQALYRKTFDYYINRILNLKQYEDYIKYSELNFTQIPISNRNIYHISSYLSLDYIYVRNFLFVEKLSNEALNYFINKINSNDYEVDENLLLIVKESYKEIIKDNFRKNKYVQQTNTYYGSFIPQNIVSSETLVIVIQIGKSETAISKEEFKNNYNNKKIFLERLSDNLEKDILSKLNINGKVFIRNYVGV